MNCLFSHVGAFNYISKVVKYFTTTFVVVVEVGKSLMFKKLRVNIYL